MYFMVEKDFFVQFVNIYLFVKRSVITFKDERWPMNDIVKVKGQYEIFKSGKLTLILCVIPN